MAQLLEKAMPNKNTVVWTNKAQVWPGIRTQPAQTRIRCFTTCATTLAQCEAFLIEIIFVQFGQQIYRVKKEMNLW